ncbi:nucleotidyltransferase [bacterium]|nr:nucleotidyltransferase [bacterium]
MIANYLLDTISKILKVTQICEMPIMFMGGIAISVWAEPRATYDVDGVVDISDLERFLQGVLQEGFVYDKSMPVKMIQGMSFITLVYPADNNKIYVDLFLAKSQYAKVALARRKEIALNTLRIPVIAPEDLILYKLLSGRDRDIEDVREILLVFKDRLDVEYIRKWADELSVLAFLEDELSSLKHLMS